MAEWTTYNCLIPVQLWVEQPLLFIGYNMNICKICKKEYEGHSEYCSKTCSAKNAGKSLKITDENCKCTSCGREYLYSRKKVTQKQDVILV